MKRSILLLLLILPLISMAETIRFAYNPSLSPDGKQLYFAYDGDIFTVPSTGGLAMRLVSLGGVESMPKVSPDGKYVAFASNIQGNNDLYVVPVDGGEVRRLTWHEGNDLPSGWSSDSKYIYFESNRANNKTTYKVSLNGGTPERIFGNYFNTIVNVAENPVTGELYFNESGESISFPTRKRYVGDHNSNIKSWNGAKKSYKELTSYEGKDTWPMVDKNGNLYYVSDRFNQESNIVKYQPDGEDVAVTSFSQSLQYPSISHDGSAMAFILEYRINLLDLGSGKVTVPQIRIADNNVEVERNFENQIPTAVAVSPDGKKFAFAIRGLLYVGDAKGKYQQQLVTPSNERVAEIVWGADNNTLYYTRTNRGYLGLYTIKADGSEPEKSLYNAACNIKNLTPSHKREKVAFVCGNHQVMALNCADGSIQKIADAQFWSYGNYSLNFSSDDSYLAFEAVNLFEGDIYIYSFKEKKLVNLTSSACSEGNPCFSPDGKYLFMVADFYGTTYPRGGGDPQVYKLPLQKYNVKPFKSDIYDKLFEAEEKDEESKDAEKSQTKLNGKSEKAAKKEEGMEIDFNDIMRRNIPMDISARGIYTFENKGKSWLLYNSKGKIYSLELSDPEAKANEIKGLSRGYFISSDKELFFVAGADIHKVDLNLGKSTKVTVKRGVEKQLKDEFEQMFHEAWGLLDQNFYDVNFHGVDWAAKREYYASFLPYVRNRANLSTLMTDMLGELNSSHLGFRTNGKEATPPQTSTNTLETGIIWNNSAPYIVESILVDSPASNIETGIRRGDELVAVNGVRVSKSKNRESYFASSLEEPELKLTFSRKGKEFDVKLHTVSYFQMKEWLYNEWEDVNRALVEKMGKGKIAYTHMRDMGDGELKRFLKDMHTRMVGKEALILDLRYNNGGNVHKEVLDFLAQKAHFNWAYRDFKSNSHPNVTPGDLSVIVLVNERSLSDAEVTSNGIQTLGLATIVGTETYRWIIFTSGARLLDGSFLRLPAWGCYSLDGKDLESTGVKPDIYVKNTFKDRLEGKDPQLERAIREALDQIGNR